MDVTPIAEQHKASMAEILAVQQQILDKLPAPKQAGFPADLDDETGAERSTTYIAPLVTRRSSLSPRDAIREYHMYLSIAKKPLLMLARRWSAYCLRFSYCRSVHLRKSGIFATSHAA